MKPASFDPCCDWLDGDEHWAAASGVFGLWAIFHDFTTRRRRRRKKFSPRIAAASRNIFHLFSPSLHHYHTISTMTVALPGWYDVKREKNSAPLPHSVFFLVTIRPVVASSSPPPPPCIWQWHHKTETEQLENFFFIFYLASSSFLPPWWWFNFETKKETIQIRNLLSHLSQQMRISSAAAVSRHQSDATPSLHLRWL